MAYLLFLGLLIAGTTALGALKVFGALPEVELKRRAAGGRGHDRTLYRAAAFGASLRLVLWAVAIPSLTGASVVLARHAPLALTLIASAVYMSTFAALDARQLHFLARWSAPALAWILERSEGVLRPVARLFGPVLESDQHGRLYEPGDLHNLMEQQKSQEDNRIAPEELERAQRALYFGLQQAGDIVQPFSKLRTIEAHESLGPIVLDELHASHQSAFLVYDGEPDNIVGTLSLEDAVRSKHGGRVEDSMRAGVTSVDEAARLPEVLNILSDTSRQLAIVVTPNTEVLGIVTLSQLVQELCGNQAEEDKNNPSSELALDPDQS